MKSFPTLKTLAVGGALLALALAAPMVLTSFAQDEPSPPAMAPEVDDGNLRAFIELVRSDIHNEKATIIAENIEFTEDEAFEFWPLHREYSLELNRLLDRRLELIRKHVGSFEQMTDEQAVALAKDVFDLEEKRLKLKRSWFKKFSKVIPAKKAAQFFQIENQLNAAVDLRLAAALPFIK